MWRSIEGWIAEARRWLAEIGVIRGVGDGAPAEAGPLGRWNRSSRAYFQKWLVIGALIGVVAGLGAIVFYAAIAFCTHLFLELGAGFTPPGPAGEGVTVITPIARPWMIPIITTLGGLLTGLIVFTFAPEAEGHGTDAAIESFHRRGGKIRARIPPIKLIASAITIGSGGSAGREGPTAQIAAGFGSWLATSSTWMTTTGASRWPLAWARASARSSRRPSAARCSQRRSSTSATSSPRRCFRHSSLR